MEEDETNSFVNYIKEQCNQYQEIVKVVEAALAEKNLSYEDREEYVLLLDIIKSENEDLKLAGEMIERLSKLLEKLLSGCDDSFTEAASAEDYADDYSPEEVW